MSQEVTPQKTTPKLNEFNTKSIVRLIIFGVLWLISYVVCTTSLFYSNWFITPIISFIALFLLIYFIALDCYRFKLRKILLVLLIIFLLETILFVLFSWFSRYLLIELVLFNFTIWLLLYLLTWQLNHRTYFSPFSYFTEWWFLITTLLTVFFCVLMMWKYTQIPFTCDDIQAFPSRVAETTINPFKNTRNKIVARFTEDEEEEKITIPEFYVVWNPLSKSEELSSAEKVETFFVNVRTNIENQTIGITNQVSKTTCNQYIKILQKTQKSWWIQIAGIVIWYLLLVWIFKILLWIISVVWFLLFLVLRLFWLYTYEKRMVEKEVIV